MISASGYSSDSLFVSRPKDQNLRDENEQENSKDGNEFKIEMNVFN